MAEKVNPIIIHDHENDRDYTIEFDRDSIKFAEQRGFKIRDVDDYPMTKLPEFLWYGLRMHHKNVSLNQAEKLLDRMGGMSEAMGRRMAELWTAPYDALNPDDGDEKNLSVTVEIN